MRKQTFSLEALSHILPVLDKVEQRGLVGGGNGSYSNPYSRDEYLSKVSNCTWSGGYVSGMGYVGANDNVSWNSDGSAIVGYGTESSPYSAYTYENWSGYWPGGYVYGLGFIDANSYGSYGGGYYGSQQNADGFKVIANLQSSWTIQSFDGCCVPAVMSYVARIFGAGEDFSEGYYICMYKHSTGKSFNVEEGVPDAKVLSAFIFDNFNAEIEFTRQGVVEALDSGHPCMVSVINADSNSPHELLIVGYKNENNTTIFKCINPGTGGYENHTMDDFGVVNTNIFEIKSLK